MHEIEFHEIIQSYLEEIYKPFSKEMNESLFAMQNEIYGELFYYSARKLLNHLTLTNNDHFLDIGFGLGKLLFQILLTTDVGSITGIEINPKRYQIAYQVQQKINESLPKVFEDTALNLVLGDFLVEDFEHVNIIYICATVFSFDLIQEISNKINQMGNVQKIIALRKMPRLENFTLSHRIFLQGSWDNVSCFIYIRNQQSIIPKGIAFWE